MSDKLLYETNAATKVVLEKQAADLLSQYDEKQTELEQLKQKLKPAQQGQHGQSHPPQNQNRVQLQWKEYLPKIDFEQAILQFDEIVSNFDFEGGAAIFLLADSESMCGDLCVERLKERLTDKGSEPPRYHEIGFLYETPSEIKFLTRLGEYYQVDPVLPDPLKLVPAIIEKLCGGLSVKSVLLIRVTVTDELESCEPFVAWFLSGFWPQL